MVATESGSWLLAVSLDRSVGGVSTESGERVAVECSLFRWISNVGSSIPRVLSLGAVLPESLLPESLLPESLLPESRLVIRCSVARVAVARVAG